ncbi:MAG: glycosyltransferase family 9 protein [Endomicrobium sp.]|nr:glycosyltransferase family 9 protein [Endomicrobium sp.]
MPALKAAKRNLDAEIFSVVKPALVPILTASGLIDGFISKDSSFFELVKKLKAAKFNKAVLFSESPFSVMSAYFSGIKELTGFETASLSFLLDKKVKRTGVPSIFNNIRLGESLGLKGVLPDYADIIKIPAENEKNIDAWLCKRRIDFVIAPGASKNRSSKSLTPLQWGEIIKAARAKNLNAVLAGAVWEKEYFEYIIKSSGAVADIFVSENGILDNAALYKRIGKVVGPDSGAAHLAASVGAKCFVIFGDTDPAQTGPLPTGKHVIMKKDSMTPEDIVSKL